MERALLSVAPYLTTDVARGWITNPEALKNGLRELLVPPEKDRVIAAANLVPDLGDWSRLCEMVGLAPDFSGLTIPKDPGGYGWIVPVPRGLTANRVWTECQKRFPCYSYAGNDLDKAASLNERSADKGSYIIRVHDRREADKEFKNRSAIWIAEQKPAILTLTLTERLWLEF